MTYRIAMFQEGVEVPLEDPHCSKRFEDDYWYSEDDSHFVEGKLLAETYIRLYISVPEGYSVEIVETDE